MTTPRDGTDVPEISFDPEAILERDSRILLDPAFLATLHEELARELPPAEAEAALLQMGFLHGLQDVTRALAATVCAGSGNRGPALAPPLRMPFRSLPGGEEIHIEGLWPDHHEAEAHVEGEASGGAATCYLSAGYTSGWLSGAFDADLLALETSCSADGSGSCRFEARDASVWRARGDAAALRCLDALPFTGFRGLVRERYARGAGRGEAPDAAGMDREAAAVHIWGPVMVLPYAGPDETLQAMELLARDAGAAEVSVIVLDLGGAIVDEAFGALALEQLVSTAEAWGAETLFVDPSPLSERVLSELAHPPLLVLKDLEPAIALGFQIARSQRRPA